MSSQVIAEWQANGPSSFPTPIQNVLATQNTVQVAQVGLSLSQEFFGALLDAINAALTSD